MPSMRTRQRCRACVRACMYQYGVGGAEWCRTSGLASGAGPASPPPLPGSTEGGGLSGLLTLARCAGVRVCVRCDEARARAEPQLSGCEGRGRGAGGRAVQPLSSLLKSVRVCRRGGLLSSVRVRVCILTPPILTCVRVCACRGVSAPERHPGPFRWPRSTRRVLCQARGAQHAPASAAAAQLAVSASGAAESSGALASLSHACSALPKSSSQLNHGLEACTLQDLLRAWLRGPLDWAGAPPASPHVCIWARRRSLMGAPVRSLRQLVVWDWWSGTPLIGKDRSAFGWRRSVEVLGC